MGRRLVGIGEFARMCGLSIKTLRLYHARGLIEPAAVDPWTGYRAYDERSLERARLVIHLRDLDVPLQDISDLFARDGPGGLASLLVRQRAVIETRLRRLRRALLSLETELHQEKATRSRFQLDRDLDARLRSRAQGASENDGDGSGRVASIVLTSSCGEAGGEALAAVLGQRIGFEPWDRPLLDAIAADPGRRARILDNLDDEQRRGVANAMSRMAPGAGEPVRRVLEVSAAIASSGRAILLDAGAHRLLPESSALCVRLEAPLEKAIPHVAARTGLEIEAARRQVEERGAATAAFELEAFGVSSPEVGAHDLVINSSTLDLFSAVELVVAAFESKFHPDPGWWRRS